jgi:hypothetical protein
MPTPTGMAAGVAGIGSGLSGIFGGGYEDPSRKANKYLDQIPRQTNQYFQPYFESGTNMLPGLTDQYGQLMNDPGARYNQIGESFQQSPGFKFALEQALGGANRAAAAGGMSGTLANQEGNMGLATNLALQDYYNYMNGATDLYKTGLGGGQHMADQGQMAGQNQANLIAQALAQKSANKMESTNQRNQQRQGGFGNIAKGLGAFLF